MLLVPDGPLILNKRSNLSSLTLLIFRTKTGLWTILIQPTMSSNKSQTIPKTKSIKGSIRLTNFEANDYDESILLFNLIPTEETVYT